MDVSSLGDIDREGNAVVSGQTLSPCGGDRKISPAPRLTEKQRGRVLSRIGSVVPLRGCMYWLGATNRDGYGIISINNRAYVAHRIVYSLYRQLPDDMILHHVCGFRNCVNPEHLEPSTNKHNTRQGKSAKLTQERAEEIRQLMHGLMEKYGVSARTLLNIANGDSWT